VTQPTPHKLLPPHWYFSGDFINTQALMCVRLTSIRRHRDGRHGCRYFVHSQLDAYASALLQKDRGMYGLDRVPLRSGGKSQRAFALDLSAIQQATIVGIERIAPMHGAAVVPNYNVAKAPALVPTELVLLGMRPKLVE
jgi:hypothetical protein